MNRIPPTLDMTTDGAFREPPPLRPGWSFKLLVAAILIGIVAAAISIAAFALWVFSMLLPVVIIAGAVAWGTFKLRRWQSLRGPRDLRPW